MSRQQNNTGANFLVRNCFGDDVFISEDWSEDQQLIRKTVDDFIAQEIKPVYERIEQLEDGLTPSIMEKFAELGLFGTHMPEIYGGSQMDFITNCLIAEAVGPSGSFSVSYNAQTGIGMLPMLYFGTEEQKRKYLPGLITGKLKSSYCLTEPSSGSDALSAKTSAVLSDDKKHYILNGQKMWITNAGFADIFTVFAQVDGIKFTAFIVERSAAGLSFGEEEHKLGIKGSSTRQVFLENVAVPVENLLGEIGKGHHIAFSVLNIGRLKLGVSAMGGAKMLCTHAIQYANQRIQFKQPISSFGAIQFKLSEMAIRCFVTDAAVYRTAWMIQLAEEKAMKEGKSFAESRLDAAEEFALECAILKILGSETLDYCADETLQIFGGMGYSEDGHIARAYRDSRINRIFEGTNEINRMLMINTIFKKAMKGELDIITPAMNVQKELLEGHHDDVSTEADFPDEYKAVTSFKKVLMMFLGTAGQMAMSGQIDLKNEQEVLIYLADIASDIYTAESALLKTTKAISGLSEQQQQLYTQILKTYFHDVNLRIYSNGVNAIASFIGEDLQAGYISGLRKFTKYPVQPVKKFRRNIAEYLNNSNQYAF